MLVVSDLADAINVAIGAKDKDNNPISTTPEMTAYAKAVIDTLMAAIVANAPGTVSATALPVPGPITNGSASNGLMTLISAIWTADLMSGFPTAMPGKLSGEATASTGYLMANGQVGFASGNILGASTATPITPGTLVAGTGTGGTISGITGDPWSSAVTGSQGISDTPVSKAIYAAVSKYIKDNAAAAYATGTVNGIFSPGGGPMSAGFAAGGTIS